MNASVELEPNIQPGAVTWGGKQRALTRLRRRRLLLSEVDQKMGIPLTGDKLPRGRHLRPLHSEFDCNLSRDSCLMSLPLSLVRGLY